ncbi:disease resistance protein RPS2-like [Neltuma alba]|uniref:disease resistance protein RPS2-like n=1 Tax=Neltuma alba TaxID=207710 RepID=UPI0010A2E150|nr:disease resistance protein RPS2-like [Prosopis alba]
MIGVSSKDTKDCSYPVRVEEIISCHTLSLVHMQLLSMRTYKTIVRCLEFSQLKEFKLVVGFRFQVPELLEKTSLAIDMRNAAENVSEAEITELIPTNVTELVIHNSLDMIERLSLHLLNAMCLKTCDIRRCSKITCILESEENNFPLLERMNISNLPKLRMICGEVVKPGTLMNLKSINVDGCSSLKCLFSMHLIFQLKSLEEITIFRCHAMEEIIEGERNTNGEDSSHADATEVILPKLQRLKLILLPNLRSIYKGNIQCDSLRSIKIYDCISLNKLPLGLFGIEKVQHVSPSTTFEQITCQKQWWESLQWDQPQAKHLLQPYFVDHHRRAYSLRAAVVQREASI